MIDGRRRRCIGAGAVLLLAAAGCGGGTLGASALEQHARSLRSGAAEGALLAGDAASGRTTDTFLSGHAAELAGATEGVESALTTSDAARGLDDARRRLIGVAREVGDDLQRLGDADGEEQRALQHELAAAADEIEQIGASLP